MVNNWVRSTRCSGGNCVEVQFVRASQCGASTCVEVGFHSACADTSCVEVGHDNGEYLIRDSKNPEHVLRFDAQEWAAFVEGVQAGEFRFGGAPAEKRSPNCAPGYDCESGVYYRPAVLEGRS